MYYCNHSIINLFLFQINIFAIILIILCSVMTKKMILICVKFRIKLRTTIKIINCKSFIFLKKKIIND